MFGANDPSTDKPFLNPKYSDEEVKGLGLKAGVERLAGQSCWVDIADAYSRSEQCRYTIDRTMAEVILAHPEYWTGGEFPIGHLRKEFLDIMNIICVNVMKEIDIQIWNLSS